MSEFDKHWDTHCISSNCEEDEAKIHFEAGQQSRQAEIDELQGWIDELKITQNNLELKAEDAECVSMSLDDQGVAKCDDDGKSYSLWGRVCQFKKSNNITERDELQERIDKAMKYVSESPLKDVSRRAMINFMDILKGNKDD